MLIALLAVGVGAVAQTVSGIGFALVCGPVLIAALGQSTGLRLVLTLSTVVCTALLATTWRQVRLRDALLMAAPGVALTPLLAFLLRGANSHVLTASAGALTLACAAALAFGLRLRWLRGWPGAAVAGGASAAMNVLAGMAGPAAALYGVNARWADDEIRPTLQVFGVVLNAVALVSVGGPVLDWRSCAALLAGWGIGLLVASRLASGRIRPFVLAVAALGGLFALWRGLF